MIEDDIIGELTRAVKLKADGHPGKARVLARRAVGKACKSLLKTYGCWHSGMSALDSITELVRSEFAKPEWKPLLSHFLLHVDEDHNLPKGVDLVDEADYLVSDIFKMTLMRRSIDGED